MTENKGECVICFEELEQGDTIARLPCLCIYHKGYVCMLTLTSENWRCTLKRTEQNYCLYYTDVEPRQCFKHKSIKVPKKLLRPVTIKPMPVCLNVLMEF